MKALLLFPLLTARPPRTALALAGVCLTAVVARAEEQEAPEPPAKPKVEKIDEMKRLPVNDWVRHETTAQAMPPSHWVYGGSDFYKGNFIPEGNGEIAAIFITDTALINYPGKDNINDEVWTVMTDRVPALETKVTLVLAPYKEH